MQNSHVQKPLIQTRIEGFEFNPNKSLTYSSLKHFKKSPLSWVNYICSPFIETEAMLMGKLLDEMLFNPDTFQDKYFKFLNGDVRTKAGKEMFENAKAEAGEKKLIKFEIWEQAETMCKAIMNNTDSRVLLDRITEVHPKFYWNDKDTDLLCSVELDGLGDDLIVEVKTDKDATPDSFQRSAFSYDYPLQTAFCLEGLKAKRFKFPSFFYIVVEKEAPINVAVYKADEAWIEYGMWDLRKHLQEFKFCADQNLFHQSYEFRAAVGYHNLTIPGWAKYKMEA